MDCLCGGTQRRSDCGFATRGRPGGRRRRRIDHVPAREMLGDLLLAIGRPGDAFDTYRAALRHAPKRFNSLYGAARAAQAGGDDAVARDYFNRLLTGASDGADRLEIREAKAFVATR